MLAHCGDLLLVLLEVKVYIAFLIAEGQDWMRFGPFQPSDFIFLVVEVQLLHIIGRKRGPDINESHALDENGEQLILVIPIEHEDSAFAFELFLDEHFTSLVHDVHGFILSSDSKIGRILAPRDGRGLAAVGLGVE